MKWSEITTMILDDEPDKAVLKRKVALRKRYARLKDKIRDKAKKQDDG